MRSIWKSTGALGAGLAGAVVCSVLVFVPPGPVGVGLVASGALLFGLCLRCAQRRARQSLLYAADTRPDRARRIPRHR
jgi:hypothetical protein